MNDKLIIGKIIGAHGIKGELKVFPITDNVRRFNKLKKCFICKEDFSGLREVEISASRVDRGNALLMFNGLTDRTEAEKYKGLYVAVNRDEAVKLQKNQFFIVDLIGLSVIDDNLGVLGNICDVYETGANFIIEVKRSGKKNLLIPFLNAICYETDIEEKVMKVKLPDGLYEIYES